MRQALPASRRLVLDLLHFAQSVPLFPVERTFNLATLAELRKRAATRISWAVLFAKAYGLLCAERPVLRQSFLRWPWPHVYTHPGSVAMVAVHRCEAGQDWLCWGRLVNPAGQSLIELQAKINEYKQAPLGEVFRRQMFLSRFPMPLRRFAWWWNLNLFPVNRGRRFGTFGLSTVAGYGATNRFHPSILTTNLTFGPLDAQGNAAVGLICDHRVIDGAPAADALNALEPILQGQIARELYELPSRSQAA